MRILDFKEIKWDKNFFLGTVIVLIFAIISGIVLFKLTTINDYFTNYAEIYVFYVFNFNNGSLFFSHFISELFYLYAVFLIAFFTRFKFPVLIIFFVRCIFATIYFAILCCFCGVGGVIVAIIIYLPSFLISIALCVFIMQSCCAINKKYVFFIPAILALLNSLLLLIIINVLFRIIIVIV